MPAWFRGKSPKAPFSRVAYFCMEFMVSEGLPIYSGGLGNVAGDQLKAAEKVLGVPVVGVGLLYQQGYFRQVIDNDGVQQALFPYNDPGQMPITPLRQENGEWLRLEIDLPGFWVWVRAWQVQVGRVTFTFWTATTPPTFPLHRGESPANFRRRPELRRKQELLLGIGGWRLLAPWGRPGGLPSRTKDMRPRRTGAGRGISWRKPANPLKWRWQCTRAGNLFTTHTAVSAGLIVSRPLSSSNTSGGYAGQKLSISLHDLLALGRQIRTIRPKISTWPIWHPRKRVGKRRQPPAR